MPEPNVGVVILTAGEASRFGGPKQVALLDGVPLLQRALLVAEESVLRPIVVVLGSRAQTIRDAVQLASVATVDNRDWERGPGTSLARGLDALQTSDAARVLLADQPFITAAAVRKLDTRKPNMTRSDHRWPRQAFRRGLSGRLGGGG